MNTPPDLDERCRIALECLPHAPYRDRLKKLLDDLRALASPQAEPAKMKMLTDEEITGCYGHKPTDNLCIGIQRAFAAKNGLQIEGEER